MHAHMKKYYGSMFGVLAALFYSISDIFLRKTVFMNGSEQTFVRYTLQLFIMIPIARYNKLDLLGTREYRVYLICRGIFGALSLICFNFCLKLIDPSDAASLINVNIVFVSIIGHFFLNEKLDFKHLIAICLSLCGLCLLFILNQGRV